MNIEDAIKYIVDCLKQNSSNIFSNYGYEIYIPHIIRSYLASIKIDMGSNDRNKIREYSPIFYSAAWELCRRGIIRPGVKYYGDQATEDGSGGNGYSMTPFGNQWLKENNDIFIPTEPERFGQILAPYQTKFGKGFLSRSQEAIRCYGAHAYLACCTMCGAAAESIILAVAIRKTKNEDSVLKIYLTPTGRSKIENLIIGKQKEYIKREFIGYTNLLKYWRDNAAHGQLSFINDNEAYTSIAILLRFAMFVDDKWKILIKDSN